MTALWTSQEAAQATKGHLTGTWQEAHGLSIDTRTLQPGDLFIALKDTRDGHDFVAKALEKGAAAALVSSPPKGLPADAPLLVVEDVQTALENLAHAARARSQAKVGAITGSVGKTSTKEMMRIILTGQGRVHAAEASYNNHWGVPLTLARMPRDADYAIIEIGMSNPGEIAPLAEMTAPHAAMITTIAPAHLQAFTSLSEIAHEKASLYAGLTPGGTAIVPYGLDTTQILEAAAQKAQANIIRFATTSIAQGHSAEDRTTDFTLKRACVTAGQTIVEATHRTAPLTFTLQSPGRHFIANALGALALAEALGADLAISAQNIRHWRPPQGRGGYEKLYIDPARTQETWLIDDAFNANPLSMSAGLNLLIDTKPPGPEGRRIAFLGDMLELGTECEAALHAQLAQHQGLSAITTIHCIGPRMRHLYDALPPEQRGTYAPDATAFAPQSRQLIRSGDVVLVKGSKGAKVSLIIDVLKEMGQTPAKP